MKRIILILSLALWAPLSTVYAIKTNDVLRMGYNYFLLTNDFDRGFAERFVCVRTNFANVFSLAYEYMITQRVDGALVLRRAWTNEVAYRVVTNISVWTNTVTIGACNELLWGAGGVVVGVVAGIIIMAVID